VIARYDYGESTGYGYVELPEWVNKTHPVLT